MDLSSIDSKLQGEYEARLRTEVRRDVSQHGCTSLAGPQPAEDVRGPDEEGTRGLAEAPPGQGWADEAAPDT